MPSRCEIMSSATELDRNRSDDKMGGTKRNAVLVLGVIVGDRSNDSHPFDASKGIDMKVTFIRRHVELFFGVFIDHIVAGAFIGDMVVIETVLEDIDLPDIGLIHLIGDRGLIKAGR